MNIVRSAFGHYEATGNPADADVIVAHSFGTSRGAGSPNWALADFAIQIADGRPIVADQTLVSSFINQGGQVDHVVMGPVSDTIGRGVGSWGTLVEAKNFMEGRDLQTALLIAQSHHVGRVAMQAGKLEMRSVVPPDLPDPFDRDSAQLWTRSLLLWLPREIVGSYVLRRQEKL